MSAALRRNRENAKQYYGNVGDDLESDAIFDDENLLTEMRRETVIALSFIETKFSLTVRFWKEILVSLALLEAAVATIVFHLKLQTFL